MRKPKCGLCDGRLILVEETKMLYDVDPEDGTVAPPEPLADAGEMYVECLECSAYYTNPVIDWSLSESVLLLDRGEYEGRIIRRYRAGQNRIDEVK